MKRGLALTVCGACALAAGCATQGPAAIPRDRFDYLQAISDSSKRQTLQNLLKIRYADAPVFLDVSNVISSYAWEGELGASAQYAPPGRGDTFGGLSANARYAERPTITYTPLSGEKFARSLMSPLPVSSMLQLIQSGYAVDAVLRICVSTVNGLDNEFGSAGNPRAGDPRFATLVAAMRDAQASGDLAFRIRTTKDADGVVMVVPVPREGSPAIRALLRLDPQASEYRVVYGSYPASDREIAIVTRSMLQVLMELASYIEAPESEVASGRVYAYARSPAQQRDFPPLLRVMNGPEAPADAYVAARYRDRWFWIDDRDYASKRVLSLVMLMFSLTETASSQAGAPIVTVPAR